MRFLVFQHVAAEHPGSFRPLWQADGIAWDTVALDAGQPIPASLDSYDALLVMGGPMDVWEEDRHPWLAAEKQAIRHFVTVLRRPYLGICLGHQLLADALGGVVGLAARPEIGIAAVELTRAGLADALFRGTTPAFPTLQWHGAEVQLVPDGGVVLAENPVCAVQAFRWGTNAYGVQFHPELTADSVAEFQAIPAYRTYLETHLGPGAAARLSAEASRMLPDFTAAAARMHRNFRHILGGDLTAADRQA